MSARAVERHGRPSPVGGEVMTPFMKLMLGIVAVAVAIVLYRFAFGLGSVTNLSDGHPWGLWITFDVVTGTALGCGGYAMALLIYVFNKGKYHPLIRAALMTSALGYTLGAFGVLIDLGRPWWTWKLPIFFWTWNLDSIQLEVALCILLYTGVLWLEMGPVFLERWAGDEARPRLRAFAERWTPRLRRAMPWLIALGLLLPTMHQSSLGGMMLLAGPKLHPLWLTPWLPFFFLVSCIAMGYGITVLETMWSRTIYQRYRETSVLHALTSAVIVVLVVWVGMRIGVMAWEGKLAEAFAFDLYSILFWAEILLFLVPAVMLTVRPARSDADRGWMFLAAGMMLTGGTLHRFAAYWFAFNPGRHWNYYFPSILEITVTAGFIAAEIAAFMYLIKRFPILTGRPSAALPS
ncbi:MAG: Ni/Fe-hydrogenase cytochrome b subunit [Gemmatimonadota bacterium]|nr:Ni/Fe-hydrogenase cytochrome b subunit [Gemmatimonadota bacterium]